MQPINQNNNFLFQSVFEALEERVLFDGVPDAAFILPADASATVPAQVQNLQQADADLPRELIIVDPGVENSDALLTEILETHKGSAFEVRMLDADSDGVHQITDLLAASNGKYDAIHVISHGEQGQISLGNTELTSDSFGDYVDQLASWSGALTGDADILFYGCDLAGNADGQSLIESISAITGADVAASDDLTGAETLGGDWDLEFTAGVVQSEVLSAYEYQGTLALADATLSIVSDGTPTWDSDNNPGNDTDGANGIIRSHDSLLMEVFYNTDSGGATDLNFSSILPDGLVWDNVPAAAALDSRTMVFDSVTGLPGGDMRGIVAYLPDVAGTFTSSVTFEARALGGPQGMALNDVQFEVASNENPVAIETESHDFVLSSAANMDIQLLIPTFRGVHTDAAGAVDGVVYTYSVGILGDHPTRTGTDAVKGSAPIEDNFTFDLDLSNVTPNATIFDWGPSLGGNAELGGDGITRNYERFTTAAGGTSTYWSRSTYPAGQTGEAGSSVWTPEHSTPDSGDWTIINSAGSVFTAQVSGADTTGSHFPDFGAGNRVLPAGENWFTSAQVSVWIPIDDILPGADGISGTPDDGVLTITPEITNFDPDDAYGITNNFGSGVGEIEDTSNNDYEHTIFAFNQGGGTKYNSTAGHPTSGRWVETSTNWSAGDGETSVGHVFDARVTSGRNGGVLALEGSIFGDKFDNTAVKITANSLPSASGDGWSRVYASGGPNNGTHLTYGTDYIIEFGTGGVGGAAGGWTDWDSMGDATLADNESIGGYWSQDPTDPLLGGNAYADGVRDSITKWRIIVLRDVEPGETLIGLVSNETIGHSTLDPANNPGGNIIANFHASSIGYLRDDANPANDWRTSEYDPLNNNVYSGAASGLNSGDRLWIVDANVDVDKTVVDLGAGSSYLAGSAATIQLEGTVTIPGPDSGAPAQDVYITDMLPAGLTVVGGSASPASGTTFTAGDGSTISVQAVEYFIPDTNSWSTTWSYGATGIRWFYGDVPLNTVLPTMTFDVLIPFDAKNGESWTNTAVASSPSDDTTEEFRSSSAGLVAVQVAAMSAGKFVVTPLVPEDTTIVYELGIANVSDDKEVPWFDLVDILPYDADFEASSINGVYTDISVSGLDAGLEVYVTTASASALDAADGTVDGFADPGTAAAGDAWFVPEGTGIWQYTLADVQAGVPGAPTDGQITAIRVVSDKAIDPLLAPGESTKFFLELTPNGNVGIPSDTYTNKFAARTDPSALPLPVTSAAVTAVVVAPDIEIEKEVALDETHANIDPTNDAHWGETVNFDDTDKAYFRLKVTNTGTADFLGATVTDNLPPGATFVAGTAAASAGDFSGFPATWTFDLAAGDTATLIYQLDVDDSGNYVNSADVEATDQWGETVDDTDDAEANFVTEISAAKQQTNAVRSTSNPDVFEVTYEVEILNSSIFDLSNLTLTENLDGAYGPGFAGILTPPAVTSSVLTGAGVVPTVNGGYDGDGNDQVLNGDGFLEPGNSVTLTYTVLVDPLLLADPANTVNQVEAGGLTGGPGGTLTTDLSDDGSDPATDNPGARGDDGAGGTDDPTPLILPSIDLTKQIIGSPVPASSGVNGNFDVTYEFMIENTGTTDLDNISMIEDFIANLGGAFQGIVNAPRVTMTTATDNPDFNPDYDGDTDTNIFLNAPTTDFFEFGGSTSQTFVGTQTVLSDMAYVIDPNQTVMLMVDAFADDGTGGPPNPASRHFLGFASYDIDGNFISMYNYSKLSGSTDTTLAAPLNPGDTTITLTDATGWSNGATSHRRSIVWYGYTDSTGYTYPDYTYTRNQAINAWDAGGVSGNVITLSSPWSGPALAAGDAIRNTNSGGSYQYSLLSNGHIDEVGGTYAANIGGGFIPNGAGGTNLWRPGTHSIRALALANRNGSPVQLNLTDFKIAAPNDNLLEVGQKVTFEITVEIDPDNPGAVYDGITGDGDGSLENQASVTAEDPYNDIPVADTSDDPTDPTDDQYGDDSDPDDPTSLLFPNIELTKAIIGAPVPASSGTTGNLDVTFEFMITNSGNEAVENLSFIEDLAAQYGGAFQGIVLQGGAVATTTFTDATNPIEFNSGFDGGTSVAELIDNTTGGSELAMGQTIVFQIIVEVDPDNATALYTAGQLSNQASVSGTGVMSGVIVDDDSDDPSDMSNNDNDGDNDPDDPNLWSVPVIDLTKTLVGDPVAASSGNQGNFDVTYDFTISNFGNAPLDSMSLLEDVAAQYGGAFVAIVPQSGVPASIQLSTATDAPEINGSYDGGLSDAEVFDNTGANSNELAMGESVTIRIIFEVDPNAIGANFDANNNLVNQATISGNHDGTSYSDDSDDPNNASDVDPNGDNNADDPNTLFIADVSVAKEVVGTPVALGNGNWEVTYQLVVENTGNAALDVSLEDDLDAQFGAAFVSAGSLAMIAQPAGNPITLDSANWDGDLVTEMVNQTQTNILEGGDFFIVQITVEVDPDASGTSQMLNNQATVTGDAVDENGLPLTDSNGDPVVVDDLSDTGSDPETSNPGENGDSGGCDDPTPLLLPDVAIAKSIVGDPIQLPNGNFTVQYQFIVENIGTTYLTDLQVVEDFAAEFGANVFIQPIAPPAVNILPTDPTSVAPVRNIPYDGATNPNLLDGVSGLLAPGDSYGVGVTVELDPNGAGAIVPFENTAVTTGNGANPDGSSITDGSGNPLVVTDDSDSGTNPNTENSGEPGDTGGTDDPTPLFIADLDITKAIVGGPTLLSNGNHAIDYSVVIENTGSVDLANLSLIEDLQSQFGAGFQNASALTIGTAPLDPSSTVTLESGWDGTTALSEMVDPTAASLLAIGDSFTITFTVEVDASSLPAATAPVIFTSEAAFASATQATLREDFTDIVGNTPVDLSLGPFVSTLGGVEISGTIVSSLGTGAETRADENSFAGGAPDPGVFAIRQSDGGSANLRITVPNPGNAIGFVWSDVFDPAGGAPADQWSAFKVTASDGTVLYDHDERVDGDLPSNFARFIGIQGTGSQVYTHLDIEYETSSNDNWTIDHIYDSGNPSNVITNQIDGSADAVDDSGNPITDSNGDPVTVTDLSDSGSDPDDENNGEPGDTGSHNDPTPLVIPEVSLVKDAGDAVANGNNWDVQFTLVYENTGTADLNNLTLTDDISSQFGNAFVSVSGLTIQNFSGTGTAPTANGAWVGGTANMLVGGAADVGDSFEIVFTVTINPDNIDSISEALNNSAVAGGDALDENGDPILDGSGNPVTVTDVSDDGTDVNGENGDDNMDGTFANDPTPIIIADIAAAKEVVGTPVLIANGNYEATYQVVIENIGTVDLANITLGEDLMAQFGAAYVDAHSLAIVTPPSDPSSTVTLDAANWNGGSSTEIVNTTIPSLLAVGDQFTFEFTVEIDAALATGVLLNTVTAGGNAVDENGNSYNDFSGNPITATDDSDSGNNPSTDNGGEPNDSGGTDDPTPLYIPSIGLAKEAGDAVANGDNFDVEFTLVWENTGSVALDNVEILDDIATQFGSQFVAISGLAVQNFSGTGSAPTANGGWNTGDTSTSLINSTGPLDVGDSFEVVFTVTIDPDAGGTSSSGLENQATSTGEALDENGDPLTDSSGDPITATDDSDNGTDPVGENGEDDMDGTFGNDPTPIIIADISVAKQVSGTPTLMANGNFSVDYELVIENNGNVDLADLTLVEDLATQFGTALVSAGNITLTTPPANASSSVVLDSTWNGNSTTEMISQPASTLLAVGDSFVVTFTVEVDPDAVGAPGALDNQVTVGGDAVDENGAPITNSTGTPIVVTDDSDSGTDPSTTNPGEDGDTGGSNDPTPLLIPAIGLAKTAGDAVANGDNWDVEFTFVYENTGTVDLTNLTLTDDIMAEFGNAFVGVSGLSVGNFSGTGTAPGASTTWTSANTSGNMLDGTGQVNIGDSFEVVFTVTINPDGIDSVSQGLENQGTATGQGINPDTGAVDPSLNATDTSDNGTDVNSENGEDNGDGTFGNDPTPIIIADIDIAKEVFGAPTMLSNGNFEVVYQLVVENTGTVNLANLTLGEDLATQFGPAYIDAYNLTLTTPPVDAASNVVLDSANWDGDTVTEIVNTAVPSSLAIGDSFIFQFTVEVDPDATGTSMALDNQVTTSGDAVDDSGNPINDSSGTPIVATDDSDSGTDPSDTNTGEPGDTGGSDDPTPLNLPAVALAKSAGDAVPNGDNFDVEFTFVYENTGTTQLTNLELLDDIATEFGNAYVSASGIAVQNFVGTGTAPTANGAWTGDTTLNMISGGTLEIGDSFEVIFTVTIDPDGVDSLSQGLENQGTANADGIDNSGNPIAVTDESDNGVDPNGENGEDDGDGTFANDPTPIIIADISVTKEVTGTPIKLPNDNFSVTYQLVIENTGTVDLANLSLFDDLANQFGGAFVSAGNLTLISGPFAGGSNVVVDSANWDGDANTEMINQAVPTALVVGDSYIVQFTVEVDPDATGTSSGLDNQVTTGGDAVDSAGNPINDSTGTPITTTDDSDSGADPSTDNPTAPGDMGTTNDPTPLELPDLAVGKQANAVTIATDGAGNDLTGSFDVQYLVVLENTGTIELTNLQLLDDLTAIATFGDAYDPTPLSGPTDRSGFVTAPAIVSHTLANPGDLPTLNAGFLGGGAQTGLFDGTSGTLQTGEQIVVSFTIRIDSEELIDGDATDGLAQNQIQGTADSDQGPVSDLSDDGLNPNGDNGSGGSNDPTPFQVPQIRLYKSHTDAVNNGDGTSTITVTLRVDNSGTVDLANLTLTEDLATQFGAAFISTTNPVIDATGAPGSNIPANLINPAWAGDTSQDLFDPAVTSETLIVGDDFTITFDVVVDPDLLDADSDYLENTATVTGDGTNFNGVTITVSDDSGADNGTGIDTDEPTSAIVPEVAIAKTAGDAVANGENWDVPFTLVIENVGSVNLDMLTLFDDVAAQFGDAYVGASGLTLQNFVGSGTAPTLNTAWEGDNSLTMVSGGLLEPGDRFDITFVITIDPDGIDSISQVLDNQATVAGQGVDQMGNPLNDSSGNPLVADDLSDDGTDPNGTNPGENGDEGTNDDPTPIVIADVSLAKTIVGTPTLLANGNYAVDYSLVAENIGTTDLANLSLTDDLATQFGPAFIGVSDLLLTTPPANATSSVTLDPTNWDGTSSTNMIDTTATNVLAVGDSYVVEFTVEIDANAALGYLDNQAVTGGDAVDPDGNPYTDSNGDTITAEDDSDSGTETGDSNIGEPGDTGTSDDPTPLHIPSVGLAKVAGDAVANGDNFDITFTLVYTNNGNVDLDNLTLTDDIASQFGNAYVSVTGLTVQNFVGTGTAPTANAAWETDTSLSMITGGAADMDDTFEVVFTVTIDPDGIDNVSQALNNQATATGDGLDENGNQLTDPSGDPLTATDQSDNGTDPNAENGEDNGDGTFGNDPTPIIIADVSVVKDIIGTPVALDNGNFEVTYELIVENTGTVDLANLSLVDALPPQFGSVFVSAGNITLITPPALAGSNVVLDSNWDGDATSEMIDQAASTLLAIGDFYVVQFTAEVDPDALLAPPVPIENQVTAGGDAVDENGDPIQDSAGNEITATDLSDDGSDPNGDNPSDAGDHGTSDDPTPLLIPDIGLAKSAGDAVPNGDNFDVTFTLVYTNTGTVALDNLELIDDVAAQFGNAYVSASNITIQNFAGTGTAPTANAAWSADTTQDMLVLGNLDVGDSFEIVFTVTIDPDGLDSISQGLENQAVAMADGLNDDGTKLLDDNGDVVTADDVSDDGTDVSGENGSDNGDGIVGNDPTPIIIADVSLAKQVVGTPTLLGNGNYEAVYQLVVENTGTVDLANLTLGEDLATQFGSAFVDAYGLTVTTAPTDPASNVTLDTANWNGDSNTEIVNSALPSLLAVGDSFIFQFTVEINAAEATGVLENTATAGGDAVDENGTPFTDSSGDPITADDDSDSGADPSTDNPSDLGDHGTSDDPTPIYIPSIGLAKDAGDAVPNGDNFDVEFTLVWENTGTVALDNVEIFDDIAAQFGGQYVGISGLTVQNFVGTGSAPTANAAWNTVDTTSSLVNSTGALNVGDTFEIVFTVTIDPDASGTSSPGLENQATTSGDGLDENGDPLTDGSGNPITVWDDSDDGLDPVNENGEDDGDGTFGNDPTPVIIADISVTKQVTGTPVLLSNGNFQVAYELVIENTGNVDLANLTLVEDLNAHFGSALISAGGIALTTPPSDASSNVLLDASWDGDGNNEMIDQVPATLLAVGDSFVVQFTVEVDPDAVSAPGALDNQVTVGGDGVDDNGDPITDSTGNPIVVTDDSDSGTDPNGTNPNEDGDTGTSDDPTPLYLPAIGLTKDAGDAVANGDNWDVEFTLVYENTGTVDLTNLTLFDDVAAQFGNAFVSTSGLSIQNFSGTGTAPGANSAWNGDNTLDMFDGTGQANIGDSFEITFTVTIDPDGIDAVSQGLDNQAVAGGDGLDGNGDPLVDGSGNPVTVNDISDDGIDPNGENGEDNGDGTFGNDPTPVIIADISVVKEVFGTPIALADGTFDVTYQMVIENTGTVDLANLSLTDDIAAQFGAPFVSAGGLTLVTGPTDPGSNVVLDGANWDGSGTTEMIDQAAATSLVVGDSYIVQFNVIVDLDATGTSELLENQVQTGGDGVDEDGNLYTDSSGNTITAQDDSDSGADANGDNPSDQGDHGTSDDPTPLLIPDISIGKIAGDARPLGDDWVVNFRLFVENTGTVALDNVTLFDDISAQFGNAFVAVDNVAIANFVGTGTAPGTNPAWTGDTALDMLDGSGTLDVGDKFQVVFRVTIDPDGIDSISQGLDNQATAGGDGINPDGTPMTDSNGDPVNTVDDSDNGTDVHGENGEDGGDGIANNDPTPIIIADISVAKEAVGTPVQLADGNFEVVYQLVIENTGTVDLANLSLVEDLATQYGSVFVNASGLTLISGPTDPESSVVIDTAFDGASMAEMIDQTATTYLAIGDSYTLQFTTVVDPSLAVGPLTNQVTTSGDATDEDGPILNSNGNVIVATDDSDSGADPSDTNPDQPGDTGTSDDPTPLQVPSVGLAKLAGDPVTNGDNWDVTFTLVYENNGTVDLNNLTLTDDIAAQFGNAFVSATGLTVQNFTGSGTAPAANTAWESDTTVSMISGGQADIGDTFEVVFTITIDPDGIDDASQALENQAVATGDGLDENGDPILDSSGNPVVATDDSDNGTDPDGENGEDNGDGTFGNDPTPIYIADISVAKEVSGTPVALLNGNFEVTYELVIENTGTVDLANLTLVEDLATQFGAPLVTAGNATIITPPAELNSNVVLNSAWDGASVTDMIDASAATYLAIGDSYVVSFTVEVDLDAGGTSAPLDNQVVTGGDGVDSNGDPILDSSGTPITATDDSDSGTDTNGTNPDQPGDTGSSDDPTPLLIPDVGLSKVAGDAVENGDYFDVTFSFTYENTGTATLNNLSIVDDVAAHFGNAYVAASDVTIGNLTGTGTLPTANGSWAALTSANMLVGGELEPGASFHVEFTVTIDPDGVDGTSQALVNQAQAGGDFLGPDGTPTTVNDLSDDGTDPNGDNITGNDPTPIIIADLGIAKTITGTPVLQANGNYLVNYQVVVENTGTVDLGSMSLIEDLATQFGAAYVNASGLTLTVSPTDSGSNIVVDGSGFNGGSSTEMLDQAVNNVLVVGDSFTIEFTAEIDPLVVTESLLNQVEGTGDAADANGDPINGADGNPIIADDVSDSGTDPNGQNSGDPGDNDSHDDPTPYTPEQLPLSEISGTVFVDADNDGTYEIGENGIEGVEITLIGTDIYGNAVELTVLTDGNGDYEFTGLNPGNYQIIEGQPEGYDDGLDEANAAFSVGNDQVNNVVLGFDENFGGNNFGERLQGASGNPSRLPPLLPFGGGQRLNSSISNFLGGPGPIYSGVPIASNGNPLTLDSGRPVTGGYATEFATPDAAADCGCPEVVETPCEVEVPCDPCAEEVIQEAVCEPCEQQEVVSECECQTCEEPVACEECSDCCNCCGCGSVGRSGGFLFRFRNWLNR